MAHEGDDYRRHWPVIDDHRAAERARHLAQRALDSISAGADYARPRLSGALIEDWT